MFKLVVNIIALGSTTKHQPSRLRISISRNVRLFVCLFTFEVPFKRLFAPTSWSWMSKIFKDSESLGKNNGKNWSQIWKLLIINGVISPRKSNSFWANFALLRRIFLVLVFLTPFNGILPPLLKVQFSNFLEFWNPCGKSYGNKWSQIKIKLNFSS